MHTRAVVSLSLLRLSYASIANAETAWHGSMNPLGSSDTRDDRFTSFWVPDGTRAIDDDNSLVTYTPAGHWTTIKGNGLIDKTTHSSRQIGDTAMLQFFGTRFEWYGGRSPAHGRAHVAIDGHTVASVDAYSTESQTQQLLLSLDNLQDTDHTVEISNAMPAEGRGSLIDIDAFVVDEIKARTGGVVKRAVDKKSTPKKPVLKKVPKVVKLRKANAGHWHLEQRGNTGVSAMQLAIIDDDQALIVDKVEHNPLQTRGHPAWAAVYNLNTHKTRALNPQSNSFCAGGTWLGNGTLINVGGNDVVHDRTGATDFGDINGLQALRFFTPCKTGAKCDFYENSDRLRLATARWYSTTTRLTDGSAMIIGGSTAGGWINNKTTNNPTIEFYPPKQIAGFTAGRPIPLPLLDRTLNANLFPISFLLPDGRVFIAANTEAVIFDWTTALEQQLPPIPNGVRVTYPMSASAILLPLRKATGFQPEILICGGSKIDDDTPSWKVSAQAPASDQCSRMLLTDEGIKRGWQVEHMPDPRLMPDMVLLPTGKILIVNGAKSGIAGYANVRDGTGQSNADNPVFQPVIYDPDAPLGKRFSTADLPKTKIARMYHSVATLTPSGKIMIAGSNPNLDRTIKTYPTEYRVEWMSPPYMDLARPSFNSQPASLAYGKSFNIQTKLPKSPKRVQAVLMDLGFVTHAIHMNSRLVEMDTSLGSDGKTLTIQAPATTGLYPPGYGWLYILADGVPSEGKRVMMGPGDDPIEDYRASRGSLSYSKVMAKKCVAAAWIH